MKTPILKPGFEFIFALSLMVILGLPPMLMAQDQKDIEIKIENGDTTVNGKNIKMLSPSERKVAMRDIRHLSNDAMDHSKDGVTHIKYLRRDTSGHHRMMTENITIRKDSLGNMVEDRPGNRMGRNGMGFRNQGMERNQSMDDRMLERERNPNDVTLGIGGVRNGTRNSQSFHYINTDNDGISTHLSFHISEVSNEDLKKMPHIEGARLTITDLNIVPEFVAGKILLLFSLPSKGVADVKLIDSEGKVLWSEKASGGSFSKSFAMGLNGIYYLEVKQGSGIAVKRILKDE